MTVLELDREVVVERKSQTQGTEEAFSPLEEFIQGPLPRLLNGGLGLALTQRGRKGLRSRRETGAPGLAEPRMESPPWGQAAKEFPPLFSSPLWDY